MVQFPSDGEFRERRRVGERRQSLERRRLNERRQMQQRRRDGAASLDAMSAPRGKGGSFGPDARTLPPPPETVRLEALLDLCEALSPEATKEIIHELRVHQIKLEKENEELRRAKAEVEAARSRYFDLYDLASVGFCTLDDRDLILEANLAAAAMLGADRSALGQRPVSTFIHPADQDIYARQRRQIREGVSPSACELRMVKADGTIFWAQIEAALAQDPEDGTACHLVLSDITTRRRMEAENRQLQKAESLGRMAGAIAHLFNNQLQTLMANLEIMETLPRGSDPAKYLAMGRRACDRAAEVSRLMLLYLGQSSIQREPCALANVCRDCLHLLRGTLPSTARLEADCPPPGPLVLANAEQLQQVMLNLVTNAREALGDATGSIRLSLRTCLATDIPEPHRLPVGWKPQEPEYACLEVADTGCGMAETDMDKLFDPFFTTKFTGRGLGLPVALGIVQAHGGALAVESREGEGSTFRVYLPTLHPADREGPAC